MYENADGYAREEFGRPMRYHTAYRDIFDIVDNDPTSAAVTSERSIVVSRGDWHASVVANDRLDCDEESFHATWHDRTGHS